MDDDAEKAEPTLRTNDVRGPHESKLSSMVSRLTSSKNVEQRGIVPVPLEERTNRRTYYIVRIDDQGLLL